MGYGELSLGLGSDGGQLWLGDWEIALHARKGTRYLRVGSSLAGYPAGVSRYGDDFGASRRYLYGQLFTGYGETLINYDHALTAIRVGIGFTDRSTRSQ